MQIYMRTHKHKYTLVSFWLGFPLFDTSMKIIHAAYINKKDKQNHTECVNEAGFGLGHVRKAILSLVKDVYFEGLRLLNGYKDNKHMKDLVAVSNQVKLPGVPSLGNVGPEKHSRHDEEGHVTHVVYETIVVDPV